MRPLLACLILLAGAAHADGPRVLRLATQAPDGTAWARELKAFAREVQTTSDGQVGIKWYFGAVAGDETEMLDRVRRGQLDGAASGGPMCETLAPSMRTLRVLGVLANATEAGHVLSRIGPRLEEEAHAHGFALIGTVPLGPHILFSRRPVRTFDELRKTTFWVWDRDDVMRIMLTELGVKFVPLPVQEAGRAYEQGRIDGFIAPPSVALGFQWSAQARFVADLRLDWLSACVVVSERSFDSLPNASRQAVRAAAAKLTSRFGDVSVTTDAALLGGLFLKQGVTTIPVSETFRSDFYSAAQAVREKLKNKMVDPLTLAKVLGILADFRAEHTDFAHRR